MILTVHKCIIKNQGEETGIVTINIVLKTNNHQIFFCCRHCFKCLTYVICLIYTTLQHWCDRGSWVSLQFLSCFDIVIEVLAGIWHLLKLDVLTRFWPMRY